MIVKRKRSTTANGQRGPSQANEKRSRKKKGNPCLQKVRTLELHVLHFSESSSWLGLSGKTINRQRPPRLVPRSTKASLLREQKEFLIKQSQPKEEKETVVSQRGAEPLEFPSSIESASPLGGSTSSSRSDVMDGGKQSSSTSNKDSEHTVNAERNTKLPGPSRRSSRASLRRSLSSNTSVHVTSARAKIDSCSSAEVTQDVKNSPGNNPVSQPSQPAYQDSFSRRRSRSLGGRSLKGSLSQVAPAVSSQSFRKDDLQQQEELVEDTFRSKEVNERDSSVTGRRGRLMSTAVWVFILFLIVATALTAYYFFLEKGSQSV